MTDRRRFLALGLALLGVATTLGCSSGGSRCATCGMKIDEGSRFTTWLLVDGKELTFDTPQCALHAWRGPYDSAHDARFREYYSQEIKSAKDLAFVSGSDIAGPMGPEIVAVSKEQAERFVREHGGGPPLSADALRQGLSR